MLSLQQLRMRKTNFDMELPVVHQHSGSQLAAGFYRTSRWLCLFTTCLAFIIGVGVGVAVPIFVYTMPVNSSSATLPLPHPAGNVEFVLARPGNLSESSRPPLAPAALQIKNRLAKLRRKDSKLLLNPNSIEENNGKVEGVVSFVEPYAGASSSNDLVAHRPAASAAADVSGEAIQGIYWSQAVEDILPAGFGQEHADRWHSFTRRSSVVRLEEGCGRMQNRLITFENGTRSCCRYRQNFDQIQGEIFSFYLSRLLGLRNLPPSSLGLVRAQDEQWNNVRSSLSLAQWTEDRPVVYTQFLNDLEPAYIPEQLRGSDRHLNPTDMQRVSLSTEEEQQQLITLAQWSDLIVLDYLTANLDRMVNNMYNMQWNPAMMDSPAHNLARNTKTGLLVFLDNESGLLHGYRLLDKYEAYHKSLLDSVCLFRRSTVESLRSLQKARNVGDQLRRMFESQDEQLVDYLPFLPEKSIKTLNHRIDRVLDQVAKCQTQYGGSLL